MGDRHRPRRQVADAAERGCLGGERHPGGRVRAQAARHDRGGAADGAGPQRDAARALGLDGVRERQAARAARAADGAQGDRLIRCSPRDHAQVDRPGEGRRSRAPRGDHGDPAERGLRGEVHHHRVVAARRAGRDACDPARGHERRATREARGDGRDRHGLRGRIVGHLQVGEARRGRQREHDLLLVVLADDDPAGPGVVVGVGTDVGGGAGEAPLVERGRAEHGAADGSAAGHERLRPRRAAVVLEHAEVQLPACDGRGPGERTLRYEVVRRCSVRARSGAAAAKIISVIAARVVTQDRVDDRDRALDVPVVDAADSRGRVVCQRDVGQRQQPLVEDATPRPLGSISRDGGVGDGDVHTPATVDAPAIDVRGVVGNLARVDRHLSAGV